MAASSCCRSRRWSGSPSPPRRWRWAPTSAASPAPSPPRARARTRRADKDKEGTRREVVQRIYGSGATAWMGCSDVSHAAIHVDEDADAAARSGQGCRLQHVGGLRRRQRRPTWQIATRQRGRPRPITGAPMGGGGTGRLIFDRPPRARGRWRRAEWSCRQRRGLPILARLGDSANAVADHPARAQGRLRISAERGCRAPRGHGSGIGHALSRTRQWQLRQGASTRSSRRAWTCHAPASAARAAAGQELVLRPSAHARIARQAMRRWCSALGQRHHDRQAGRLRARLRRPWRRSRRRH